MAQAVEYQPLVLVETADLSREEWLAYRRQGLGGSDAAAVLGISPFRTAVDLYYDKRNLPIEDDCHPANKNSKRKRNKIAGEEEKRVPQKRDGR